MKRLIIILAIMGVHSLYGQYTVNYMHANPFKFSLVDLSKVRISSQNEKATVEMRYSLIDDKRMKILEIDFQNIHLVKGTNSINYNMGKLNWENTPYRELLLNDRLSFGNYTLCIVIIEDGEALPKFDDCFDIGLNSEEIENPLNVKPIELQSPENKDSIEELRPMLIWIPPSPAYMGTFYYLVLTEKKENQSCTESLNNNVPIIEKKNIVTNILNFPTETPELIKGKKYCWRVSAVKDEKEYSRSEDWEFVVRTPIDKIKSIPLINEIQKHILYEGDNTLEFALRVNNNLRSLDYSVYDQNNIMVLDSKIQPIELNTGINEIKIDISQLRENIVYLIKLNNIDNIQYEFNFIKK